MRHLALLLVLATAATTLSAAEVRVVRVFTGWRDAASFKRISEYFTGRENSGGEVVLRTQPAARGGYYFLVRTDNDGPARDIRFRLEVVTPGATQPRHFEFSAALPAGNQVYQLGLTGADWAANTISPMAWKLELVDADGKVLATEKSYLWEKPAQK
ncbi:MAG: hypothetical protein HZA32_19585 [Opitutae bacterium]|nr:hypothetical protein [Opitutae bacterium]